MSLPVNNRADTQVLVAEEPYIAPEGLSIAETITQEEDSWITSILNNINPNPFKTKEERNDKLNRAGTLASAAMGDPLPSMITTALNTGLNFYDRFYGSQPINNNNA